MSAIEGTDPLGAHIQLKLGDGKSQHIFGLILDQTFKLVSLGIVCGLVLACLGARALTSLLYATPRTDPITYLSVACLPGLVALVARYAAALSTSTLSTLCAATNSLCLKTSATHSANY
jgi:hypothetical protein